MKETKKDDNKPPQYLDYWEEIEGLLINVKRVGNELILTLEIRVVIEIPYSQSNETILRNALRKKIGVLRTDSDINPYRFTVKNGSKS